MRTPGDDFDLAIGHLLTEAMLHSASRGRHPDALHRPRRGRLPHLQRRRGDPGTRRGPAPTRPRAHRGHVERVRRLRVRTIDAVRTSSRYAVADDASSSHPRSLAGLPEALRARQPVFDRTGGVHAAGLATAGGELLVVREDVGRHNAVDKVGRRRGPRARAALRATVLVVSARASFEIVQKASVAGIPVVVAVGAPSSLAVELAAESGITLVAFTRPRPPVGLQPTRPAPRRRVAAGTRQ